MKTICLIGRHAADEPVPAMTACDHDMLRRHLNDRLVPVDPILIIALHEIDLDPGDAPLFISGKG